MTSNKTLIVSATEMEISPISEWLQARGIDVLITGVGMVATAARTARALALTPYDLALNIGLCGSFDPEFPPGSVVHVTSDHLVELGAEDGDKFLTVRELGLQPDNDPPFEEGRIVNSDPPVSASLQKLSSVEGITVNTVHGNARSIEAVVRRFLPQVESMEGAAFMFACATADVRYAQVRAVSNFVEPRNRVAWKIEEAIAALDRVARDILDSP